MHHSTSHLKSRRTVVYSSPEALENRIAPAAVLPEISNGGKTATWTDVDGDSVTLTITKGTLDATENFDLEAGPHGGAILQKLNLTGAEFNGTAVTIKAVRDSVTGGDNSVNIGFIDATDNTLGAVKIAGDLAQISAGKTTLSAKTSTAIKSLNVKSMGLMGDSTLDQPGDLISSVSGKIGTLSVAGSVQGVFLNVTGGSLGSIGAIKIGSSLVGTEDADSGRIVTSGNIGAISLGGNIIGGAGQRSGTIEAGGDITSVSLIGSVIGGKSATPGNDNSGLIHADGKIGSVTINGSIIGGTQQNSGVVSAGGDIARIVIGSSIFGGEAGAVSGAVISGGSVKTLTVGNVIGGAAEQSGYISIAGSVNSFSVKGNVEGGTASQSGFIRLGTDSSDVAGVVTIDRDLIGGSGDNSGVISANASIKKLSIEGSIHGGTGNSSGAILSSAAVADLSISGNLIGGDLAATATSSLSKSGYVEAASISKLKISGSIHAGTNYSVNPALDLVNSASIRVANNIGSIAVQGNIEGNTGTSVLITARGNATVPFNSTKDVAIGKISVGGSVSNTEILAGYNLNTDLVAAAVNPNAQIGAVAIKKDWLASDLVAGAAYNDTFGDGTDSRSGGVENPDIIASIASITIGGQVVGTADVDTDHYGFVAEQIVRFQLGTSSTAKGPGSFSLNSGASNDNDPLLPRYNVGATDDTRIFEFA